MTNLGSECSPQFMELGCYAREFHWHLVCRNLCNNTADDRTAYNHDPIATIELIYSKNMMLCTAEKWFGPKLVASELLPARKDLLMERPVTKFKSERMRSCRPYGRHRARNLLGLYREVQKDHGRH